VLLLRRIGARRTRRALPLEQSLPGQGRRVDRHASDYAPGVDRAVRVIFVPRRFDSRPSGVFHGCFAGEAAGRTPELLIRPGRFHTLLGPDGRAATPNPQSVPVRPLRLVDGLERCVASRRRGGAIHATLGAPSMRSSSWLSGWTAWGTSARDVYGQRSDPPVAPRPTFTRLARLSNYPPELMSPRRGTRISRKVRATAGANAVPR
jgi:hypothetical protein